jgi:hypothetical protein
MKNHGFQRRIASPLWQYLNQSLFDASQPAILHPGRFWSAYKIQQLEQCWQINPLQKQIDYLEQCWHLHSVKH